MSVRPTKFKERLRDLWYKNFLGIVPYTFITPRGLKLRCRKRYEVMMVQTAFAGYFDATKLQPPIRTVIDVGANIGIFSLWCFDRFGASLQKAVAIEPFRRNSLRIEDMIRRNALGSRMRVLNLALGKECGHGELRLGSAHYSHSLLAEKIPHPKRVQPIEIKTLDRVAEEYGIEAPDLVKIDVEGAELEVLAGGSKTLQTVRCLMIETHLPFCNSGQMEAALRPFGLVPREMIADPKGAGDLCFYRP